MISESQRRVRMDEMSELFHLEELRDNAICRRILDMYLVGDIVTREEALCQMVKELSVEWSVQQEEAFKTAQSLSNTIDEDRRHSS